MESIFLNMSLTDMHKGLINKEFTSVELTGVSLSYIKKDKTNSFITDCEEKALNDAKAADERLAKGEKNALLGIPIALKDNICTKGVKTTCASKMLKDFFPPYSATVTERLESAGAVIIGKTNMDEFAMGSSSKTSYFGRVINPHNKNYVAGGSSGGSAAAVASGICPVALGSDTGGSIRQPASFCGITAIKPTYGRVSRYGLIAFASSLDQIGVVGKNAEDCAAVLSEIAGNDNRDMTCSAKRENFSKYLNINLKGKTIGIPKEFFTAVSDEIKSAVLKVVDFYRYSGCNIKEISLPFCDFAPTVYSVISSAEAASNLARYDGIKYGYRDDTASTFHDCLKKTRGDAFGFEVKRRIMFGNFVLSGGNINNYYGKAVALRRKIEELYNNAFDLCDVIISPTAPTTAFPIDGGILNEFSEAADILTLPANLAGLPAVTANCGYNDIGLPIGFSITAPSFSDGIALGFVHRFEKERF